MVNNISSKSITQSDLKETNTSITVSISNSKEYTLSVNSKNKKSPNYLRIGNGTMNRHKIKSIDLLQELADSTKPEQFMLLAIKNGISFTNDDYSPVVKLVGKTSTEKQYIKLGYKGLSARGLVKRIKQSHYMINPNALIPPDYDSAIDIWNSVD